MLVNPRPELLQRLDGSFCLWNTETNEVAQLPTGVEAWELGEEDEQAFVSDGDTSLWVADLFKASVYRAPETHQDVVRAPRTGQALMSKLDLMVLFAPGTMLLPVILA